MKLIRFLIAGIICFVALCLPYRARVFWYRLVSRVVHAPFVWFGLLGRFIMRATETKNVFKNEE